MILHGFALRICNKMKNDSVVCVFVKCLKDSFCVLFLGCEVFKVWEQAGL